MTLEQTKKFTEQDENTLQYYNQNATKFIENTKSVEFHSVQDKFLSYLSAGSYILDFGCGSGRDSKYFLEKGYRVDAVDGSEEICKITREYVKIEVKKMLFSELSFVNKYEENNATTVLTPETTIVTNTRSQVLFTLGLRF